MREQTPSPAVMRLASAVLAQAQGQVISQKQPEATMKVVAVVGVVALLAPLLMVVDLSAGIPEQLEKVWQRM